DHVELAAKHGVGIVIETPTWRANKDWAARLGYGDEALADKVKQSVGMLEAIRDDRDGSAPPMVISGNIGPRGDGYHPASTMTADQAQAYHAQQIETFAGTAADQVTALTLCYTDEAIGIARAAKAADIPSVISFTVETDGRLPDGTDVSDAIAAVDKATEAAPAYYMLNCMHPTHLASNFASAVESGRLRGIRANASRMSHVELDNAEVLDAGNPAELGEQFRNLREQSPGLTVLGGCCGSDVRHVRAIAEACI
ncbi:MAG: homocysteine S-methyltransferase family protein, partial [Candidatus Nanopelagicales bacterium]